MSPSLRTSFRFLSSTAFPAVQHHHHQQHLTNQQTLKCLKRILYNDLSNGRRYSDNDDSVQRAFAIYRRSKESENSVTAPMINLLLKICAKSNLHRFALSLWPEIESISNSESGGSLISYSLLLKCSVIALDNDNIDGMALCLQTLRWLKRHENGSLVDGHCSRSICSLISKVERVDDLKQIQNLIPNSLKSDSSIITAMIRRFADFDHFENAMDILKDSSDGGTDGLNIGNTLKMLLDDNRHDECFVIYRRFIVVILALKYCIKSNRFELGQQIIFEFDRLHRDEMESVELQNAMISFYGHFGKMNVAMDIFERIPDEKKDAISVRTMLRALVQNEEHEKAMILYLENVQSSGPELEPNVFTEIVAGYLRLETPRKLESLCDHILNVDLRAVRRHVVLGRDSNEMAAVSVAMLL